MRRVCSLLSHAPMHDRCILQPPVHILIFHTTTLLFTQATIVSTLVVKETMSDPYRPKYLTSIETSINKWSSDVVISFIGTSSIGAAWGCFNPIPIPGSRQAFEITKTRKFIPLPPFSSLSSVGYYAAIFGTIAVVQRFTSGGLAVARGRDDIWNNLIGFASVGGYWWKVLSSETRVLWNNRAVGGFVAGSIVYANIAP